MRAICSLLLVSLAGCARTPLMVHEPVEIPIVKYESVPVPEALLTACKVSLDTLKSNQDLELALAATLIELRRCTADKDAIRELR